MPRYTEDKRLELSLKPLLLLTLLTLLLTLMV